MATKPLVSDYLVPPGHYVRELLEHYGLSQEELAERMGRPKQAVSEIINAKKEVTEATAFELESVLGTPAHVWLNLECAYRYGLEARERGARLMEQAEEAKRYPYKELCKLGFVADTRDVGQRVANLLRFLGVADLGLVQKQYAAAFRTGLSKQPCTRALAAWLRIGERRAEAIDTAGFNKGALRQVLPELRRATRTEGHIDPVLNAILNPCGVVFVSAPHLPKTYANGACFFHGSKAVVFVSVRGAHSDIIWFTLFHEIGHLLLHDKKEVFVEGLGTTSREEDEANEFARDTLIPPAAWQSFTLKGDHSEGAVLAFAAELEVAAGIVVGRLMHEHQAFDGFSHLRHLRGKMTCE
jgi:HTH-type transcriptional regulator/antitoxin HigA